jgi:hypothetical protein
MKEYQLVQTLMDRYGSQRLTLARAWGLVEEAQDKWILIAPYPLPEAGDLQQREWVLAYASAVLEPNSAVGYEPAHGSR